MQKSLRLVASKYINCNWFVPGTVAVYVHFPELSPSLPRTRVDNLLKTTVSYLLA